MNESRRIFLEDELERYDGLLIAAESWAKLYEKDVNTHAKLIRTEAKYMRNLRKLFRDKADLVDRYIDWYAYGQIQADYTVDVVVSGDFFDGIDSDFITISFDNIATATSIGAQAGEAIYKRQVGIETTDAIIQQLTKERVAWLVGKKVDKATGLIIDNPSSKYSITDTMRNDIKKSIQTSISLKEDRQAALARIQKTIKNPKRAEKIAQTETVNAYSGGMLEFGRQSGATHKEWQTSGLKNTCATCLGYESLGIVPLDYLYEPDKILGPAAHPGDRCGLRLVYPNEINN